MDAPTPRQERLLQLVRARGFAPLEALAEALGVSAQTVRRDVARLTELRLLQRFHGGAGVPSPDAVRLGWSDKRALGAEAKARIGAAAAAEVPPGASVFLDVGTTVEAAAAALARRGGPLRVVTTSLRTALALAGIDGVEVTLPGGVLRGADGSLAGGPTLAGLEPMRVDVALLGCSGFDPDDGAPMDWDLEKVAVKRAMLGAARRALVLADARKHARPALMRIAPTAAVAMLVTDEAPPPALSATLAAAGTEVLVADQSSER
jgi:DeoR family glycerol-3-phosphate regulon repressor